MQNDKCCGNCLCFTHEDADGFGICFLDNETVHCSYVCDNHMERGTPQCSNCLCYTSHRKWCMMKGEHTQPTDTCNAWESLW